jgi:hypothetical protein
VYAVAVWVFLWRHEIRGVARASVEQMTNSLGMCRRSAFNAIKDLKTKGFLKIIERGNSWKKCSRYAISPSATSAFGAPVLVHEVHRTSAPDAPLQKKVSRPSSQKRRSGQTDERDGTRSVCPPDEQTNPDGGTIPLGPPSADADEELTFREVIRLRVARLLSRGLRAEQIMAAVMDGLSTEGEDAIRQQWARDEVARLCATGTA